MLTEHFVASVGASARPSNNTAAKDVGIFIHELQPLNQQKSVFKKSVTSPNCLAVSDSHIYAAQTEKAVVNVYDRFKGNQQATVPFTEKITCIALVCNDAVLALGTLDGRILLWETASGRQVTTSQSHLQAVTALAVDPHSNFLLSASADSTIHVWSMVALLSFFTVEIPSPTRTLNVHRSRVNALLMGHSAGFNNIAISASADKICLIWDYFTGTVLRTYLLPEIPLCLALDPADRGVYVGYEDGSVQQLDFLSNVSPDHDGASASSDIGQPSDTIQPPKASRWTHPNGSTGAALCISVSFDGSSVISGHESGIILLWDIARRGSPSSLLQLPLSGPVTNLSFLPVEGFGANQRSKVKIRDVVKPKFAAVDSPNGSVPSTYTLTLELASTRAAEAQSPFLTVLSHPSFPEAMLDAGLNEVLNWGKRVAAETSDRDQDAGFMALDGGEVESRKLSLEEQNASLKSELEALRRLQKASFEKMQVLKEEKRVLASRGQNNSPRNTLTNGNGHVYEDGSSPE